MLGVCYYPEHWDESRWRTDARRMRELGVYNPEEIPFDRLRVIRGE